mmetsp:Transcript_37047/g.87212  ORF Transcript_37047/g.87212 Transcript_37047/m.87212 type:complete len:493 (+) Transcript_37047:135-1613(+)|eukprot:CAMPEP_0177713656 /NCGR_PEP_ID=MMETSP0484_2-20121128/13055_1 /TAXON_ID=354590 /ORGANISM="Rhodomonas lens, Strain RHODO" /LENGTH=492 /DNA_ID=CAMNT_0019225559 /DNA_START=134 /DNA_END=1612 /DNA_ORIENTATION=+
MTNGNELDFLLNPTVEQLLRALASRVDVHFFIEAIFIIVILYLLFQKTSKRKGSQEKLSASEVDALCEEWQPEPLVSEDMENSVVKRKEHILSAQSGSTVTIDGVEAVNFASFDFLNFLGEDSIKKDCERTIRKYGVGSCGPRGFYGTIDVHLELEKELANFMGTEAGIIYSYDVSTVSSVIPAFLKRGDLVVRDEAVNYAVLSGLDLSRAYVKEFRHNDVADLERILEIVAEADRKQPPKVLNRRFIVVEGLYQNTGMVCPLPQVVALANKFKFRVLLEESMSFGTLGATGRGCCEHHLMKSTDVTLICGSMSTALATVGGFSVSDKAITSHQRLSSTGYCFSASLPPFNATAAISALRIMKQTPQRCEALRKNAATMHALLNDMTLHMDKTAEDSLWLMGDEVSPVKHIHLKTGKGNRHADEATLQQICDKVLSEAKCALVIADYSHLHKNAPKPSIRITVCAGHTTAQMEACVSAIARAAANVFDAHAS